MLCLHTGSGVLRRPATVKACYFCGYGSCLGLCNGYPPSCAQEHVRKLDWRKLTGSASQQAGMVLWLSWEEGVPRGGRGVGRCPPVQICRCQGGETSASPAELVRLSCPSSCGYFLVSLMLLCSIIYPGNLGFFTCGFGKAFTQMFCPGGLLTM